jgi:flagellar basal body-associated protein FliL
MRITIFIVVAIFSFVVVVVVFGTNAYTQSDKVKERQQESEVVPIAVTEAVGNMTDKMKYLCIKIDASGSIDQIKDKEQKAQCKKFLDGVNIFEMRELIDKYLEVEDN